MTITREPPRIARHSLRDQIRDRLVSDIVYGRLAAGDRVNESALARELDVSQTPVREALLCLEGERLVTSRPGRGFRVSEMSEDELRDLFQLICDIEVSAVRRLPPLEPGQVGVLETINDRLAVTRAEHGRASLVDKEWHRKLVEASGKRLLVEELERLHTLSLRYELPFWDRLPESSTSVEEHRAIIHRLAEGDREGACEVLRHNWLKTVEPLAEGFLAGQSCG